MFTPMSFKPIAPGRPPRSFYDRMTGLPSLRAFMRCPDGAGWRCGNGVRNDRVH